MKNMKSILTTFTALVAIAGFASAAPDYLQTRFPKISGVVKQSQPPAGTQPATQNARSEAKDTELHRAARAGDLALLRTHLQQGADPNVRNAEGRTVLLEAVAAKQTEAARLLVNSGANVNAKSIEGRTPLIEAAAQGQTDMTRLLIDARADLNVIQRGSGSALEVAERLGHNDVATMLREAGARSSGRSVGDTICVRPWKGDGFCGTVEAVNKTAFQIRVTKIVGCQNGCSAKIDCSAGRPVGGPNGIAVGDVITTVSWCLTHTGVQP
jgi:hypothetical protein